MAGSPQVRRARRKASVRPSPDAPLSNAVRIPVKKVYGAKSKYMPEGASVYERERARRKALR